MKSLIPSLTQKRRKQLHLQRIGTETMTLEQPKFVQLYHVIPVELLDAFIHLPLLEAGMDQQIINW
eukprot:15328030-Ditylum_brightwellii.AAC.1